MSSIWFQVTRKSCQTVRTSEGQLVFESLMGMNEYTCERKIMMVLCDCLTCFHVVMMIIMLWPVSGYLWQSPLAMCAVHHQGLHPASLWAALISQKQPEIFSLTMLLRPHLDYKPPFPSDKIDQSGLWLLTLGNNFICSQLQNMILGQRLIKSPVILLPPATERRVPRARRSAQHETISQKIPSRVGND